MRAFSAAISSFMAGRVRIKLIRRSYVMCIGGGAAGRGHHDVLSVPHRPFHYCGCVLVSISIAIQVLYNFHICKGDSIEPIIKYGGKRNKTSPGLSGLFKLHFLRRGGVLVYAKASLTTS